MASLLALASLAGCFLQPEEDVEDTAGNAASELWWYDSNPWSTTTFDVCFDTALTFAERTLFKRSVNGSWATYGHVRFRGWGDCPAGAPTSLAPNTIWVRPDPSHRWVASAGPTTQGYGSLVTDFAISTTYTNCVNNQLGHDACNYFLAMHEMGHVLGYGHEHERPETPSACSEPWHGGDLLTDYDPRSVMHYCAPDYVLSQKDVAGHALLFGPGLGSADRWPLQPLVVDGVSLLLGQPKAGSPELWGWTTAPPPGQPKRVGTISSLPLKGRVVVAQSQSGSDTLISIDETGPLAKLSFIDPATNSTIAGPIAIAGSEHGVDVVPVHMDGNIDQLLVTTRTGTILCHEKAGNLDVDAIMPDWKLREIRFTVGNFRGTADREEIIVTTARGSEWWELDARSGALDRFFSRADLVLGDVVFTTANLAGTIEDDVFVQTAQATEVIPGAQLTQAYTPSAAAQIGEVEVRRFRRGSSGDDGVVLLKDTAIEVWIPKGPTNQLRKWYTIHAAWSDTLVTVADLDRDGRDEILVTDAINTQFYPHGIKYPSASMAIKYERKL